MSRWSTSAREAADEEDFEVDTHYKGASHLGHGKDYHYPHSFPGHHVAQLHLPDGLTGWRLYEAGHVLLFINTV